MVVLTSALRNVWKPLKPVLLSTCTLGVDLRASRLSPGVPAWVIVLLRARLGQTCPDVVIKAAQVLQVDNCVGDSCFYFHNAC